MKKILTHLIMLLSLTACNEIDIELNVIAKKLSLDLIATDSSSITIPNAKHDGKVKIDEKEMIMALNKDGKEFEFSFKTKGKDSILYSNEPMRISSEQSEQPVTLIVNRVIKKDFDVINLSIYDREEKELLATTQLINKNGGDKRTFDENKNEFLSSYQKLKSSQRTLIFEIDGEVDAMMRLIGNLENAADNIVNYSAMVYVSPWAYSRYSKIHWILSDDAEDEIPQQKAWSSAIKESPVIDFVSWVHSGNQYLKKSWVKGKKENQLRMVYVGACSSGNSQIFITDHNAAVANGHRNTSASPLFQFSFFRNWIYGKSFSGAIKSAWESGVIKAKTLEFLTFAPLWQKSAGGIGGYWKDVDAMLYDSEMLIAYTADIPANNVSVDVSAIRTKKIKRLEIITEEASKINE